MFLKWPSFLLSLVCSFFMFLPIRAEHSGDEQHRTVSLRLIGHEFLLSLGDTTSRVLPLTNQGNSYVIEFTNEFSFVPDDLFAISDSVIRRTGIADEYIFEVQECESGLVVHSWEMRREDNSLLPCKSRAQPKACYQFVFTILSTHKMQNTENSSFSITPFWKMLIYLVLPLFFLVALLFKRVQGKKKVSTENGIALGSFLFDEASMVLIRDDEHIELTGKECMLLKALHNARNTTLERDEILSAVWGDDGDYVGRTLDVFISKLRKKLESDPKVKILNVRGVGYKLVLS
jgi:hypothetical protein